MYLLSIFFAIAQFNPTLKEIFTDEYSNPMHEVSEMNSAVLQKFIEEYAISTMIDAGCGAAPWTPSLSDKSRGFGAAYIGIDIVDAIVANNQGNDHVTFRCLDITEEVLPQADLILCRNTLDFFSYRDILAAIEKFKQSQSIYLIVNTCPSIQKNQETSTGLHRKINLQSFPFFFQEPLSLVEDSSEEGSYLGIWKLEEIDLSHFKSCAFPSVTFLTKPVGYGVSEAHWAVAHSVIRGLKKAACDYNVNPDIVAEVKENVVITANHHAALQAYEWKKENRIKTLMVGPNFAPSTENFFIAWPLVTCYLGNSEWYEANLRRINPALENRICRWFAGVDENDWNPSTKFKDKQTNKVLMYHKTDGQVVDEATILLQKYGYSVIRINYGGYKPEYFKKALQECKFAVFVSQSETQGIALAEAWSMDVPTLVWNPKTSHDWDGYTWIDTSACPYMNPMVGLDWQEMDEFRRIVESFESLSQSFEPRRWVLLNMTDKISVEKLLSNIRARLWVLY